MKTPASAHPVVFLCYQNRQTSSGPWSDATRPGAYPRNAHPAGKPPWRWGLRALAAVATASALAACAQAPQTGPAQSGPAGPKGTAVQDNKQQLLGFLTRLKQAIDADVVGKPERLREVLGLEVLEWDQFEVSPLKLAQRWRYNVPAMDAQPLLFRSPDFGYGIGSLDPAYAYGYGLRVNNLATVACVSPDEADAIFGHAPLLYTSMPAPLHGYPRPLDQPLWGATSHQYRTGTRLLLTLSFRATDARPPVATCLNGFVAGVGKARGLPPGYPR